VFGVLEVETATGVPFRALVAIHGDAAGVFEYLEGYSEAAKK